MDACYEASGSELLHSVSPLSLFLSLPLFLSLYLGLVISQSPPHSSATQDAADGPQEVAGV